MKARRRKGCGRVESWPCRSGRGRRATPKTMRHTGCAGTCCQAPHWQPRCRGAGERVRPVALRHRLSAVLPLLVGKAAGRVE
jgi:hypothetical protein